MLPLSLAHRKADYVQVTQLLSRFGLRQRAKTTVSALSGGEQQRVALCRALLMRPAVVFADEPTGALDTANSELVLQVLRELADAGSSVVMVTHDTDAAALADHVATVRSPTSLADSPPSRLPMAYAALSYRPGRRRWLRRRGLSAR